MNPVRLTLSILLLLTIALSGWSVTHRLVALGYARVPGGIEGLEEALEWDSTNPDLYVGRAFLRMNRPEHRDLDSAVADLEKALELNPFNWRVWMSLGRAHEVRGDFEQAEKAFRRSVEISPVSGYYQWNMANFYLRQGNINGFVQHLQPALALLPNEYSGAAATLVLNAGIGAETVLRIWPRNRAPLLSLLRLTISQRERAEAAWGPAFVRDVWAAILAVPEPLTPADGQFFLAYLLELGDRDGFFDEWNRLMEKNQLSDPGFSSGGNVVWNGGFEQPIGLPILGWEISNYPGFSFGRMTGEGQDYSAALRLEFAGTENLDFNTVRKLILLEPGKAYRFTARIRAERITTDQGLFFQIHADPGGLLFETEQIRGSQSWEDLSGIFVVPEGARSVRLSLRRMPSRRIDSLLGGTLWIDEVRVSEWKGEAEDEPVG